MLYVNAYHKHRCDAVGSLKNKNSKGKGKNYSKYSIYV